MTAFNNLLEKHGIQIKMHNGVAKPKPYFGLTGGTVDGRLALSVFASPKTKAFFASVLMDTSYFGDLIKKMLRKNPFEKIPLFSNVKFAGYVSTTTFQLPVRLPKPFDGMSAVDPG